MSILLVMLLFVWYQPVYPLPEIIFKHIMLHQANSTGQLPTCNLHQFADVSDSDQCQERCKENNQCVYCMFKDTCGSTIGCLLCVHSNNVGSVVPLPMDTVIGIDYVKVKVGACEHYGVCPPARDCSELMSKGYITNGVYPIRLNGTKVRVYCDMETQGGGWTVFQRRKDGSEDFYRTWTEYEAGFGNLTGEFWLGNKYIAKLTSQDKSTMRIELSDFWWTSVYALYEEFMVDSNNHYRMTYTSFKGNIGDSLQVHSGMTFSTKDKDLDQDNTTNCAVMYRGAWWYEHCHASNLNGIYHSGQHNTFADGVNWKAFRDYHYSLRFTEMKIRPKNFRPHRFIFPFHYGSLPPRDCSEYKDQGFTQSGIYPITPRGRKQTTFKVYCDMETSGGGWTVLQKRFDGSVDFYQNYTTYQKGFGSLDQEFWLGNDPISHLTEQGPYELRVDLEAFDGEKRYALYDSFSISRDEHYKLWVGTYSGNAGDDLSYYNSSKWSTFDKDNDNYPGACAIIRHGAWWYNNCQHCNLNGLYGSREFGKGLNWYAFKGSNQSMRKTQMKIRPAGYQPREW